MVNALRRAPRLGCVARLTSSHGRNVSLGLTKRRNTVVAGRASTRRGSVIEPNRCPSARQMATVARVSRGQMSNALTLRLRAIVAADARTRDQAMINFDWRRRLSFQSRYGSSRHGSCSDLVWSTGSYGLEGCIAVVACAAITGDRLVTLVFAQRECPVVAGRTRPRQRVDAPSTRMVHRRTRSPRSEVRWRMANLAASRNRNMLHIDRGALSQRPIVA
jgi:hypothetical protein